MTIDTPTPEEFAAAAQAPIEDAMARGPRDAARILAGAGLTGVCAAEADGGLGLGLRFAVPIAQAAGRLQLRAPLVEAMLLARAFAGTSIAAALVSGERLATIAWGGSLRGPIAGPARHAAGCDWMLVAEGEGEGADGATLLRFESAALELDESLDPEAPQAWLRTGDATTVARLPAPAYARLRDDACVLLAALVTGAARGAIARTAEHVATRVQFGRPLSARQAVRHTMARMQLLAEVSDAAVQRVLEPDEFGTPRDPRATLSGAIEHAAFVLERAIHLHGGMGFTWELPLHRSLREVRAIDAAFGTTSLPADLGRRFIEAA
jgi:alkylation response protein AidB-like acyl-CoA dehydrogenase